MLLWQCLQAAGGGNNQALEDRIAAVEQENQRLKQELDAMKGGSGTALKIYKVGETATYYDNGMPMFSIRYVTKGTVSNNGTFTFTNIGLPNCVLNQLIAVRYQSTTSTSSTTSSINSTSINKDSINITLWTFGGTLLNTHNQIYFYSPSTYLTYAIFEI